MNFKYYNTDRLILLVIALAFIFGTIATSIHHFVTDKPEPIPSIIVFTDSFTLPFFMFTFLYFINNKWWKNGLFKWLIDIPNLNGRYVGKVQSSYLENGQPKIIDCVLEIKQTASNIHIFGYFGELNGGVISSTSVSTSESIVKEKNDFFRLYYVFTNETGGLPEKPNNHSGTAKLLYFPDKKMLEGEYYNMLKNNGIISVTFEQYVLLGRLVK